MKTIRSEISRRNLLRYLGNAAISLPFMRTLMETQAFGEVNQKRAVFFYYPTGYVNGAFHPTQTGSNFTLPGITAPLQSVQKDILILKNLNIPIPGYEISHEDSMNYILTGYQSPATRTYHNSRYSIDSEVGKRFKDGSAIPVVRLGSATSFSGFPQWQQASFFAPGQASQIENDPTRSFAAIFGGGAGGGTTTTEKGLSLDSKKSLIDRSLGDLKSLQNALGTIEKKKLDLHVESLRELERRLQVVQDKDMPGGQCMSSSINLSNLPLKPSRDGKPVWITGGNHSLSLDLNIQIAIQALACGVTRVVYIQATHSVCDMPFSNFEPGDQGESHHRVSHYKLGQLDHAPGGPEAHIKHQAFYMAKLAKLIEGLGSVKEGDKSILYNTSLMATSEIGDSSDHSYNNMGTIVAGQAGGYFKTGQCIDVNGAKHNQLLVTMLHSLGFDDQSFGDPKMGTGPIAALKA